MRAALIVIAIAAVFLLYVENMRLRLEISRLAASNRVLSTKSPADAQCVAWLFHSDLDAARNRMCGTKEKRPGK